MVRPCLSEFRAPEDSRLRAVSVRNLFCLPSWEQLVVVEEEEVRGRGKGRGRERQRRKNSSFSFFFLFFCFSRQTGFLGVSGCPRARSVDQGVLEGTFFNNKEKAAALLPLQRRRAWLCVSRLPLGTPPGRLKPRPCLSLVTFGSVVQGHIRRRVPAFIFQILAALFSCLLPEGLFQ